MELKPAQYYCQDHGVDLTADVLAQLEADTVASFGVVRGHATDTLSDPTFTVLVRCPGATGGESHDLIFRGTARRA